MKLIYLFDPLCGWCYGATPAVAALAERAEIAVYATGLFADDERIMDSEFAQYAWQNDQRIQQLTGQPFSENYRHNVLRSGVAFNSLYLTEALYTQKDNPTAFFALLKKLQQARYVDGLDTANADIVQQIAKVSLNPQATQQWILQGQKLARQFGVRGVPALFLATEQGYRAVPSEWLYREPELLPQKLSHL